MHVDDAALAILKALEAPRATVQNQIFNVGSDEQNYTIEQVGEIIQRLVPTAEILHMGSDGDRRNYQVNFSKIRNTLHFVPQWNVEQGDQQVISRIQSGQITDYCDPKYVRVLERGRSIASHSVSQWVGIRTDQ